MHKIYIDAEGWGLLKEWALEFPNLAFQARAFFKKCELHLSSAPGLAAYVEHRTDRIKVSARQDGALLLKMNIIKNGMDYKHPAVEVRLYEQEARVVSDDDLDRMIDIVTNSYILANSYLFFGNIVENKKVVAAGRNENNYKVIIFRKYKDKLYAVEAGARRSPEGIFSVRGHLRRYKTGKIIWVDEYLKGLNKEEEGGE